MSEFNDMLRRVKLDKIIGYLMYGTEDFEIENKGTFEDRIEDAFDKIFESLEKRCPFISRENEELQNIIMEFSITHNEVYLEIGILLGIQMYKNLEQQNFDWNNIQAIINRNISAEGKNRGNKRGKLDRLAK